jgi:hypothetical protein
MSKRLQQNLLRRARAWAGQLTKLAKGYAPNHVAPAISSHVENKEAGFIIRITADRKIAPDARAQEFGSGLHARRGVKKKYLIAPKTKKALAFNWEVANASPERFIFAPDGRVLLQSVQHPGIEAANGGKGYIAPAMNELRKKARADLDKDIREAIMGDLRESFGRKTR